MTMLRIALCLALLPTFSWAETVQDSIISQLRAQGFTRIEVSRTLLGRVRLEAQSDRLDRELVFNPSTGEILRDYWQDRDDDNDASPRVLVPQASGTNGRDNNSSRSSGSSSSSGSNSGRSSNSGSDDDDDDRSGKSRNSGSGNSGSGKGGSNDRDDDDDDRSGKGGGDD